MMEGAINDRGPIEGVRVFNQNVQKNSLHVDVLLNTMCNKYDIVFIQEPPVREIRRAPSTSNKEGEAVIGAPTHPEWLYMARPQKPHEHNPRVMAYVSKRLSHMRPSLRLDLINHPDILVILLSVKGEEKCLMNVYNSDRNAAVLHISDCIDDLPRSFIYMGGDFNIHSHQWDPDYRGHEQASTLR